MLVIHYSKHDCDQEEKKLPQMGNNSRFCELATFSFTTSAEKNIPYLSFKNNLNSKSKNTYLGSMNAMLSVPSIEAIGASFGILQKIK